MVLFFRHCLRSAPASINLYCGRRFISPSVSETHGVDPITAGNAGPIDAAAPDPDVSVHRTARNRPLHQASARDIHSLPRGSSSFTPVENIAIIAGTQNTASLTQFSRLLYAALHAIQPAAQITSADRHRVSTLASQEGVQQTVLVGDSFAAGWNEKCLDVVGMAERSEGRATRRCWW